MLGIKVSKYYTNPLKILVEITALWYNVNVNLKVVVH
jgi:hypothetical protein